MPAAGISRSLGYQAIVFLLAVWAFRVGSAATPTANAVPSFEAAPRRAAQGTLRLLSLFIKPGNNSSAIAIDLLRAELRLLNSSSHGIPVDGFGGRDAAWIRRAAAAKTFVEADLVRGANGVMRATNLRDLGLVADQGIAADGRLASLGEVSSFTVVVTICGITPALDSAGISAALFDSWESFDNRLRYCSHGRFGLQRDGSQAVFVDIGCPYPGLFPGKCPDDVPSLTGEGSAREHLENLSRDAVAVASGNIEDGRHRFVIYVWPESGCVMSAYAYFNFPRIVVFSGGAYNPEILMHEGGHTFGIDHPLGPTEQENDWVSEVCGSSGARCFNSAEQWAIGWDDPVELSLAPGDLVLRELPNFITSSTASLKVSVPSSPGWDIYVAFVANADMNKDGLRPEVADRLTVTIWNEPRFQESYSPTKRLTALAPGDVFEHHGLVFRLHSFYHSGASKSAIASVCRKSASFPCDGSAGRMVLSPGFVALIGTELTTSDAVGFFNVGDALDCFKLCRDTPSCKAWSLDARERICWIVEKVVAYQEVVAAQWFISGYVRIAPPQPPPKANVRLTVNAASVRRGARTTLRATVTRADNRRAVTNVQVTFRINNSVVGRAKTNAQGVATLGYTAPRTMRVGRATINARFDGSASFKAGSGTAVLTVRT
ncbi:hypothetical protein DFJ74DRAFT_238725 [Hyaloraphidium curvatum]|nr:hypothetical protein DFJ74DRAFT_238725 [Hyaloraphidium curvatum]